MTRSVKSQSRHQGFSLVELLVALAIGSLLAGLLGNAIGGIATTTRTALDSNDSYEEQAIAERIITHFLKNALPPNPHDLTTAFIGDRNEISFNASPPDSMLPFGVLRVHFYLGQETGRGKSLFMDVASVAKPESGRNLVLEKHRIYRDVSTAAFSFTDSTDKDKSNRDTWRDTKRLPSLISLTVEKASDGGPISIKAAPRRNVNVHCRLDQISFGCGA